MKLVENAVQTPNFNLRFEKWIPVIQNDGSQDELGLEEALVTAHEWRAISDPLPTVEFGIYRLLVAFVLDIFAPKSGEDWADLWDLKEFDRSKVVTYFDENEGVFNLFGDKPFLQSIGMGKENLTSIAAMTHSFPSGSNANHFHHGSQMDLQLSPEAAARWLTAVSPFAIQGGRGYYTGINGSPPWYVLPLGENGFETLLLNTPVYADLFQALGDEIPAWRSSIPIANEKLTSSSLLQSLTWRPRRVQLLVENEGGVCSSTGEFSKYVIRSIKYSGGEGTDFDWTDPNAAYSVGEKRLPFKPQASKEVWRDIGPLALLNQLPPTNKKEFTFQRPAIVSQVSELVSQSFLQPQKALQMAMYGLRCKEANIFEWQRDSLNVPMELIWEDIGQNDAQSAIELAEKIASRISTAIRLTAPLKDPDKPHSEPRNPAVFKALIDSTSKLFWRNLRPHFDIYLQFLGSKPNLGERTQKFQGWRRVVSNEGWRALKFAIENSDSDSKALKRQTDAYAYFSRSVFFLTEPEKAAELKEKKNKKEGHR